MYTMHLADIRAQDYEAFRRILIDTPPDAHNKWSFQRDQRFAQIRGGGNEAIPIEVYPDEFASFCRDTRTPANLHNLDRFAHEKAKRQGPRSG